MTKIIAGTGHRPDKLGGYSDGVREKLEEFAATVLQAHRPTLLISGMALGWDQALAASAVRLDIPFHAYVPFEGQEDVWPQFAKKAYRGLIAHAAEVVMCTPGGYSQNKLSIRNMRMVDDCTDVLALWRGDTTGGTFQTVSYAQQRTRPILNVWADWEKF